MNIHNNDQSNYNLMQAADEYIKQLQKQQENQARLQEIAAKMQVCMVKINSGKRFSWH